MKRFPLNRQRCLALALLLALPAGAQEEEPQTVEAPVILYSGKGKGEDDRVIQYSGDSSSPIIKNHRAGRPQMLEKSNPSSAGSAGLNASTHNVYSCIDNGQKVFADEDNKAKFTNCVRIAKAESKTTAKSALTYTIDDPNAGFRPGNLTVVNNDGNVVSPPTTPTATPTAAPVAASGSNVSVSVQSNGTPAVAVYGNTCSGAISYQGHTYIFNEQEACPIPLEVFRSRKPLEALPAYYLPPVPQK